MKKNLITSVFIALVIFSATAQDKKVLTAADYEKATRSLSFSTSKLVYRSNVNPTWLPDGRFWYSVNVEWQNLILVPGSFLSQSKFGMYHLPKKVTNEKSHAQDIKQNRSCNEP